MSVKIILSRSTDPPEKRELTLGEETISLGRDPSNTIPLPGTQVSKHHASIMRHGADYAIVDLNSTNCTYVNNEKLTPGTELVLHRGDKISIADYELKVSLVDTSISQAVGADEGVAPRRFDASKATKTDSAAANTSSEVLERWTKLSADIQRTLEQFRVHELAHDYEELLARCEALEEENTRLKAEQLQPTSSSGPVIPFTTESHRVTAEPLHLVTAEPLHLDDSRLEQISRVLLQLFYKLSSGRSSFLSEFIMRTTIRTSNDLPNQPRTDAEVLRYFTDSGLSDKEFQDRLNLLKKEADQVVLHMIGILEGYRRSVDEGARRILQRVDPDKLEEELPDTVLLRYIPALADLKLFRIVRNRLRDLVQEDRGVLEKQVFRPGFARAYVECVEPTSAKV